MTLWLDSENKEGLAQKKMDLIDAVVSGRIESVKVIIFGGGGGADVNGVDGYGWAVLHRAAANGHIECVKILLDAKADVDKEDSSGASPLHYASCFGYADCVKVLITHKANINARNKDRQSSLHWAAKYGNIACIEELIQAGAELNGQSNYVWTPLTHTISLDFRGSTERLLDAGAKLSDVHKDVNIPDWVEAMVAKRKNVVTSLQTFIGVMRKRFETEGPHVGNRVPRDLLKLLMIMLWSTRFDEKWEVK